ncbi:MAG: hypothetical protein ACM3XN_05590 [Chloroflexota bacterium]
MAETDNDKKKRGDILTPRQSFADDSPRRRRREPQLQKPVQPEPAPATASDDSAPGEVLLTWRVDRLRERPLVTAFVIATLAGLLAWLQSITRVWPMSLLLTGVVVVSLAQFLFPTTYALHENGLVITNVRRDYKPWYRFAVMRVYPDAVQIGPRMAGVRARWNKGTLIYFGRADKDEITRIIRERIGLNDQPE